jgi:phosphoglycolate phosphatase
MISSLYKIILFDLDGTLLDTSSGIIAAIRRTVSELKLEPLSMEVLRTFIGPPVQNSFARVYGMSKDDADATAAVFRNYYKQSEYLLQAIPYDGIYKVCDTLTKRDISVAVATYKRQDYAEVILNHFGFNKYTKAFYGADFEGKLTKSDIILQCLNDYGISDTSRALMIGDTSHDAIGAQNLQIPFLGVSYGFGFRNKEEIDEYPNIGLAHTAINILDFI